MSFDLFKNLKLVWGPGDGKGALSDIWLLLLNARLQTLVKLLRGMFEMDINGFLFCHIHVDRCIYDFMFFCHDDVLGKFIIQET